MNVLEQMGLTTSILGSVDKTKSTTLRFQASETCEFLKEETVNVPSPVSLETTEETNTTGTFFGKTKKSSITRAVAHVKEFHWKVGISWEISLYSGTDVETKKIIMSRSASSIIVRSNTKEPPCRDKTTYPAIELSLKWFLTMIDTTALTTTFKINTQDSDTKTPRRNKDIDDALEFMSSLRWWAKKVKHHFSINVEHGILKKHNPAEGGASHRKAPSLDSISPSDVFCPILPLMEEKKAAVETNNGEAALSGLLGMGEADTETSPVLSKKDMHMFLNEQIRSLNEKKGALSKSFPDVQSDELVSVEESFISLFCEHIIDLILSYDNGVGYIENMLKKQLIAAIGKELKSDDLDQFIKYHNAKLLKPQPVPFCHAIRRPHHYPEGLLSIECSNADSKMEPVETLMRAVDTPEPLQVPLNAATTLEFSGPKYLHGWVQHRFESDHGKSHQLIARARQFSSFILIVGTMVGPNRLDPKDAIILQNKDEVIIPLLLEELPTPKEFKDAIQSLSPEQQRFAKAFRSMQLESSVFGVCIMQIKPQLETLLQLPPDALTKEMKLTQDLMELFVGYQVPSDLLSYDGPTDSISVKDKVDNVRGHVKAVLDVIESAKTKQLEDSAMRADMAIERAVQNYDDDSCGGGMAIFGGIEPERAMQLHSPPLALRARHAQRSGMEKSMALATRSAIPQRALNVTCGSVGVMRKMSAQAPPPPSHASCMAESAMFSVAPALDVEATISSARPQRENQKPNGGVDSFTYIPKLLDEIMGLHDNDNALRSTIVKTQNAWIRKRQENLLSKVEASDLSSENIKSEKNMAFDLMDALSRSGSLPIACTELHVIVSVTHRFENDLMGTVVQDNINPVEKLEKSTLMVASAIHGVPTRNLVAEDSDLRRLTESFPRLLGDSP